MPCHRCSVAGLLVASQVWGLAAESSGFVPTPVGYARRHGGRHHSGSLQVLGAESGTTLESTDLHLVGPAAGAAPPKAGARGDFPPAPLQVSHADLDAKWNTSSFLGGIAVGVVATLLLIGSFMDRQVGAPSKTGESPAILSQVRSWVFGRTPEAALDPETAPPEQRHPPAKEPRAAARAELFTGDDPVAESLHLYWPRLGCLVIMLLVQSISSIILAGFQGLVEDEPQLMFYLTMIVGLGGNAGGQSAVLTVRQLALGQKSSIFEQFKKGVLLSLVMAPLAYIRAVCQRTPLDICFTISLAAFFITMLATTAGTALPRIFAAVRIDPAHSTPVIQVLMDITGIMIVCGWGVFLLRGTHRIDGKSG